MHTISMQPAHRDAPELILSSHALGPSEGPKACEPGLRCHKPGAQLRGASHQVLNGQPSRVPLRQWYSIQICFDTQRSRLSTGAGSGIATQRRQGDVRMRLRHCRHGRRRAAGHGLNASRRRRCCRKLGPEPRTASAPYPAAWRASHRLASCKRGAVPRTTKRRRWGCGWLWDLGVCSFGPRQRIQRHKVTREHPLRRDPGRKLKGVKPAPGSKVDDRPYKQRHQNTPKTRETLACEAGKRHTISDSSPCSGGTGFRAMPRLHTHV